MSETILSIIVIVLFLSLTGLFIFRLVSGGRGPNRNTLLLVGFMAVLIHAYLLYLRLFAPDIMDISFLTIFSLIAWVITALMLVFAWRDPVENLAIGILPIAALAVLLRITHDSQHSLSQPLSLGLEIHIITSIIAYSLLSIAALQAMLLYIQDSQLHNKHPGGVVRALPPLETMERLLFRMISFGFVVLCISLATGVFYIDDLISQHKTVLSFGAWILFAVLLWGRWRYGWRGRTATRWTLIGFAFLLLAYFGSKFVLEVVLHRV